MLGDLGGFYPRWTVSGTAFLEKKVLFHSFWIALESQCPVFQMGQDEWRDPAIVFQDPGLRKSIGGVEVLFKVR
jgi:hypothetical protein